MSRPNPQALQRQCDDFNARYPVGQTVLLRRDSSEVVETVTITEAQVFSGHSAVIWLHGVRGCYLLDRVTPITDAALARRDAAEGEAL